MAVDGRVVGLVLACLVLPSVSAEPWLQSGHDAGRTSWSRDPGPAYLGQAFSLELGGERASRATPIIVDRDLYVLTQVAADGTGENALHRIGLDDATAVRVAAWDSQPQGIALHDDTFFVIFEHGVDATNRTGDMLWRYELPRVFPGMDVVRNCVPPAIHDDALVIGCTERVTSETLPGLANHEQIAANPSDVIIARIDPATGIGEWTWDSWNHRRANPEPELVVGPFAACPISRSADSAATTRLRDLLVAKDLAYVLSGVGRADGGTHTAVHALDLKDGAVVAHRSIPEYCQQPTYPIAWKPAVPSATLTEQALYLHTTYDLRSLDPTDLTDNWDLVIGPTANEAEHGLTWAQALEAPAQWISMVAVRGPQVILGRGPEVSLVDPAEERITWRTPFDNFVDGTDHLIVRQNDVYLIQYPNLVVKQTLGAADGARETHPLGPRPMGPFAVSAPPPASLGSPELLGLWGPPAYTMGIGQHVLAVVDAEANVWVLGETDASIKFEVAPAELYSPIDEPVRIVIDSVRPGTSGGSTTFDIAWGDGVEALDQTDTFAEHEYVEPGNYTITVWARNDAGQTTKRTAVVHVGGTPPPPPHEPTFLESAFSERYQDTTWGVIGLLVVLGSALIALVGVHRRRSILRRELQAIEDAAVAAGDDAMAREGAMSERRRHIRQVLLDGRIDEAQFAVLDARITDLVRDGRLNVLEQRLPFLPHGMAQTLRRMLVDGHINAWEHETVLELLDHNRFLTTPQKREVRKQIEAWREQDVG